MKFERVLQFLSFFSAYTIDVALKFTAAYEFRQYILIKGGYGAGIKSEPFFKAGNQAFGEYQVTDTGSGGYCFGKRIQIEHTAAGGKGKNRLFRFFRRGEFRFKVILDDVAIPGLGPADILTALGSTGTDAGRKAAVRGDMEDVGMRGGQSM